MSISKRPLAVMAGLCLSVATLFAAAPVAAETTTLRVSAIPDEAPTELLRKFEPLGKYLEQELGMPVTFQPVSDYAGVVEALGSERLDLAWLGGFTFVQAHLRSGDAIPVVQREQDAVFTSTFITADPDVKEHADLEGKSFAFGSVSSTSGHLMPRYFMQQEGIDADEGKVDTDKVRVYQRTPTYFDYNWTVRGDLEPELVEKIRQAFLKLDPENPEHKAILDLQRASRFIETSPENYEGIEQAARAAGLLQ